MHEGACEMEFLQTNLGCGGGGVHTGAIYGDGSHVPIWVLGCSRPMRYQSVAKPHEQDRRVP